MTAGVDRAALTAPEAALAQHMSSPESDSGPGNNVASSHLSQTRATSRASDDSALPSSAETAADSLYNVLEALCCPITHVRLCPI